MAHSVIAGDPSLRLQNGYPHDDAIYERGSHHHFKLSHYRTEPIVLLKGTELKQALSQIGDHPCPKDKARVIAVTKNSRLHSR